MEIKGNLKAILPTEKGVSKSGKDWQKRSFVIETGGPYSKSPVFEIFKAEIVQISDLWKIGDELTVSFELDAREYNGKYYLTATAWKVASTAIRGASYVTPVAEPENAFPDNNEDGGDLPF